MPKRPHFAFGLVRLRVNPLMSFVDPVFCIPLLFFACATTLLGVLLLQVEVAQAACKLYFAMQQLFVFVVLQIDQYWTFFCFLTTLLVIAVCTPLYLFVLKLYDHHHLQLPVSWTRLFLANALGILMVFVTAKAGAATNNDPLWFNITGWMIVIQVLLVTIGHTWNLTKVDLLLKSLEQNGSDYKVQRRALLVVRIAIGMICIAVVANQLTREYYLAYGGELLWVFGVITGDFLSLVLAVLWHKLQATTALSHVKTDGGKLVELTDRSREFLVNVSGFLISKQVLDATAEAVLPHKWMEQHPSFTTADLMEQKNLQGERVKTLDELIEVAAIAKTAFDAIMRKIVRDSGLNPEMQAITQDGLPIMLDLKKKKVFKVLTLAPLKSAIRMAEKATNELEGDFSKIVDVVRCSVVVFTEEQLESVAQSLKQTQSKQRKKKKKGRLNSANSQMNMPDYRVVRLKNRFKHPLFNGYRDALYNIVVNCGNIVTHVCEVQLHLADIVAHKESTHVFYEYFRTYFNGSRAEASRMEALEKIGGCCEGDVDHMIDSILRGSDLNQLHNLAYLIEDLMGDVKIALLIRKRILELNAGDLRSQLKYGLALSSAGKLLEAEMMLRNMRSEVKRLDNRDFDKAVTNNLASLLKAQGKLSEAEPLFRAYSDTWVSINNLASLLQAQGKLSEAEPLFRQALDVSRQQLGNSHPNTLTSMNNLASLLQAQDKLNEAEPLFRQTLDGRKHHLGNSHPDTLSSINNLALLLQAQGKLSEGEPLFRQALDGSRQQLGNSHPNTLTSMNNLASLLKAQGKLNEAEPLFRQALDGRKQHLGNSHPDTLASINNLASLLYARGKLSDAEPLFRQALDVSRQQLGNSHPDTLTSINNLASLLKAQGKLNEAEPLFRQALDGIRHQLGNSHPNTLSSINNLASLLQAQGKLNEAEPLLRAALDGRQQQLGNSHPNTLASINNLASLLQAQGKLNEAEPLFRQVLDVSRQQLGNSHPNTLTSINNLGLLLQAQDKLSEAEPLLREALDGRKHQLGNSHPDTLTSINNLASLLQAQGKLSDAEPLFRPALDVSRQQLGNSHPNTLTSINNLAMLLYAQGKLNEAEPLLREALGGRKQHLGNSHPDTLSSNNNLASLLFSASIRWDAASCIPIL